MAQQSFEGIIEAISSKEGIGKNKKPYVMYQLTISGKKYSTFDADLYNNFKIGDNVRCYGDYDGKYFSIKSMEKLNLQSNKTSNQTTIAQSSGIPNNSSMQTDDLLRKILAELCGLSLLIQENILKSQIGKKESEVNGNDKDKTS